MRKLIKIMLPVVTLFIFACGGGTKEEVLTDPQIDAKISAQLGHYWSIAAVAFSPDGAKVATSGYDKSVRVWDVASGNELLVFKPASVSEKVSNTTLLKFHPDGKILVGVSENYMVTFYDIESGTKTKEFKGSDSKIKSLIFTQGGKLMATGGNDNKITLWDFESGSQEKVLEGHTNSILSLSANMEGTQIASASYDSTAIVWDIETGKVVKKLEYENKVDGVAFSPDSTKLVVNVNSIRQLQIYNVKNWKVSATIEEYFNGITFIPGTNKLVTQHLSATQIWDVTTGEKIKEIKNGGYNLAVNNAGTQSVNTDMTGAEIYDLNTGEKVTQLGKNVRTPLKVYVSPTGKFIIAENSKVSGSGGNDILCYPVDTAASFLTLHTSGSGPNVFDFELNQDVMLKTSGSYSKLDYYDLHTGQPLRGFEKKMIAPLVISPDGSYIVARESENNKNYAIFDAKTGDKKKDLISTDEYHYFSGITPDGKYFAMRTMKFFKVWEMPEGKEVKSYEGRDDFDNVLFVDKLGEKYVGGELESGKLTIKDIVTGEELFIVPVEKVKDAAISPDQKFIALACEDWTVHLYDIAQKKVINTINAHNGMVVSVAFAPNSKYFVTASHDNQLKVWETTTGKELLTLIGVEKTGDYEGNPVDFIAIAPNGRIDGTEAAINKYLFAQKGTEKLPISNYVDSVYTKNLIGRTLGQDFVEPVAAE